MDSHTVKAKTMSRWLESENWCLRIVAERLHEGKHHIPLSIIEAGLLDSDHEIALTAATSCRGRTDIPLRLIQVWAESNLGYTRLAALEAATDRPDVPFSIIASGLASNIPHLRKAAARACRDRLDVPLQDIERWAADPDWHLQLAAMEACSRRDDVPYSLIEDGLHGSLSVRAAAKRAAAFRGKIFRSFEPTGPVYEKCLGNVIVVAKILNDAHVVGAPGQECRASKALIKDVIGKIGHERVGISLRDRATVYRPGEQIIVADFDFSETAAGSGFHFYTSMEEAKLV